MILAGQRLPAGGQETGPQEGRRSGWMLERKRDRRGLNYSPGRDG
jgi:hypothetical protein